MFFCNINYFWFNYTFIHVIKSIKSGLRFLGSIFGMVVYILAALSESHLGQRPITTRPITTRPITLSIPDCQLYFNNYTLICIKYKLIIGRFLNNA